VLAAFRAGDPKVRVETGAKVRVDFLRGLFLGDYDEKADYRGTCIENAIISDVLDMDFCETKFPVRFRDCSFAQEIRLQQLTCPELDFGGCALKEGIDALGAKVAGDVHLTKVNAQDQVRLSGAAIGGQLSCTGGSFQNKDKVALNAQSIKVASDVFLSGGFKAVGEVRLSGADIGGQLVCVGGSFQNEGGDALNAQSIKVASGVFLRDGFKAVGVVSLAGAEVGQNLILRKKCELTHLSLAGANVLGEFQDDAEVYKDDQGNDIALNIGGFRYQRLNAAKERVKDRLAWVGLMSKGDEFRPQPYEQLMKVYRATGHTNWARDVGFALESKRQQAMQSQWWKGWYRILRLTIGYGYRPFRFFGWFLGIIFVGGIFFSGLPWCGVSLEKTFSLWKGVAVEASKNHWNQCEFLRMHPTHAEVVYLENGKPREIHRLENYPRLIPLLYAAETAFPLFPLGQTGNWHPATWWVKFIQWFITLLGTVALAILVFYGAGLLGPRWRDG